MAQQDRRKRKAVIAGAGLVGCLAAIMLAKEGYEVVLVEARQGRLDPRTQAKNTVRARSINLAVSARGIEALKAVDEHMSRRVLKALVPMTGRMIHTKDGQQQRQPYGLTGKEAINSIDRSDLNASLIQDIEQHYHRHIDLRFEHKLTRADFDKRRICIMSVKSGAEQTLEEIDLTIGCDGAYSKVREQMMRVVRMDFKQSYIPHGYLELAIPPGPPVGDESNSFLLDPNHLHIWPRHQFMLIALPNQDRSFTCTLFAPFGTLDRLKSDDAIMTFFRDNFADALPMIGEKELLRCFAENPRSPLLSVECNPLFYKDKALLIGDSSHCMVPFYGEQIWHSLTESSFKSFIEGQGMNCGFEDVRVLQRLLQKHPNDTRTALQKYNEERGPALAAIQQLAQQNYEEMASKVVDPFFLLRKRLDGILARLLGENLWCPLYTMVTFRDDIPYDVVVRREGRQKRILNQLMTGITALSIGSLSWAAWRFAQSRKVI